MSEQAYLDRFPAKCRPAADRAYKDGFEDGYESAYTVIEAARHLLSVWDSGDLAQAARLLQEAMNDLGE